MVLKSRPIASRFFFRILFFSVGNGSSVLYCMKVYDQKTEQADQTRSSGSKCESHSEKSGNKIEAGECFDEITEAINIDRYPGLQLPVCETSSGWSTIRCR